MRDRKSLYRVLLLLFCACRLVSQTDTILARIKTNGSDTSEAKKYIIAGETIYLSDLKNAAAYWRIAYAKATEFSAKHSENSPEFDRLQNIAGEAMNDLGYVYNSSGLYDSAIYILSKGLEIKLKYGSK